jgi:dipeptide/tripeptide permease
VPGWFDKKKGAAFGLCFTGSSLGGVIFPIMITHLIPKVGFPWTMRTCAFLILGLLIIANLTVRPRVAPKRGASHKGNYLAPWREPASVFLMTGFFLVTFGIFVPIDYIQVQARAAGMGSGILQYIVPILNAARFVAEISLHNLFANRVSASLDDLYPEFLLTRSGASTCSALFVSSPVF